jgi:dienelactone hydrolase
MRVREITYFDGDKELHGLVFTPAIEGEGRRPGILVVHDGFGISDHLRDRARAVADLGYVAFVADLYGKAATATSLDDAFRLMAEFQGDAATLRFRAGAGLSALAAVPEVDSGRLAAIGYCFGGMTVLEMARSGLSNLQGVASFHGLLKTPRPACRGEIKSRVLVLTGADDPLVPVDDVSGFQQEMREAGANWELITYGAAKHAFTNPAASSYGLDHLGYNEIADRRSWQAMKSFLAGLFN